MYMYLIYRVHVQVLNGYDETRAKRPIASHYIDLQVSAISLQE